MLGVFAVLFGPSVFAHFTRIDGPTGWGYGYGYGFGYGYGWDQGSQSGYQTVDMAFEGDSETLHEEFAYEFTYADPDYTATEISFSPYSLGSPTTVSLGDDDYAGPFSLPYTFNFYGNGYNEFYISSNGYISFGDGYSGYPGQNIPDSDEANNLIAGAWDDACPGCNGTVQYETFGTSPNQITVIEYIDVASCCGSEPAYSWQIHLHENGNVIQIHTDFINLLTADEYITQGVENSDGTRATATPGWNRRPAGENGGESFFDYGYGGTYGWGFGYGITNQHGQSSVGWNYDDDSFHIDAADVHQLAQAGIVRGDGDNADGSEGYDESLGSMDQAMFVNPTVIHSGNHLVTVFEGTTVDADEVPMNTFFVDNSPNVSGLSGVKAKLQLGVGGDYAGENIDMDNYYHEDELYISLFVGESYNGDELLYWVYDEENEAPWYQDGTCYVEDGYCSFWHDDMTRYAIASGLASDSSSDPTPASVTVVLPNGGEVISGGGTANIVWVSSGSEVTGVRLSYSINNGGSWTTIASGLSGNSYSWSVPNTATTNALVKAEAMEGSTSAASDVSNAVFTIQVASSGGGGGGGGGGSTTSPVTSTGGVTSGTANTREEANACLPDGYGVDSLVKIPNDGNPDTEFDTTVYYLGFDCKRHPFPSRQMYDSWYSNFSGVQNITLETLSSITLGAPIMVRPGTNWVKISSDPKTYYVEPGNRLRWITDEATAVMLGGADWATKIIDVDSSLFTLFTAGAPLTTTSLATEWPSGSLVRSSPEDGATIFYVTSAARRPFSNMAAFQANMFQMQYVEMTAASASWMSLPAGAPISGLEDTLFSLMH